VKSENSFLNVNRENLLLIFVFSPDKLETKLTFSAYRNLDALQKLFLRYQAQKSV
jgi:hypothetical protein